MSLKRREAARSGPDPELGPNRPRSYQKEMGSNPIRGLVWFFFVRAGRHGFSALTSLADCLAPPWKTFNGRD